MLLAAAETVQHINGNSLTQMAAGGVFAIIIIREVFAYTKGKKANGTNGFQKAATCVEIVKRFDMNFTSQDKRFDKIDIQLDEVKDLIRKKP